MERQLVVLERNELLHGLGLACLIVGPLAFLGGLSHVFSMGYLGFHLAIAGALMRRTVTRHNQKATPRRAKVSATKDGVFVDGKLRVARAAIADGFYQPRADGPTVRLVDRWRNVLFEAEASEVEARELLSALGFDPRSRRAQFQCGSPLFSTVPRQFGTMIGAFVLTLLMGRFIGHEALVPIMLVALIWFFRSKIIVGVDGVLLRWLWWSQFIPMKEIVSVHAFDSNSIRLKLRSGKDRILYTANLQKQRNSELVIQGRDAIVARIRAAADAASAGEGDIDAAALVARGTRSASQWLEALSKLGNTGGYRDAVVRPEDLLRIVEDPASPEDARAGAAIVLRQSGDESITARVRVAAEASASPKLRVALDAAASGSDEMIEEAVEHLADQA